MDLKKMFETQKKLRDRIDYTGPGRYTKLVLALLVELGECANEQRSWEFWSKDQKPRIVKKCWNCQDEGVGYFSGEKWTGNKEKCETCNGTGIDKNKNPLLEEYVDGLHFFLEIGIELGYNFEYYNINSNEKYDNIESQFIWLMNTTSKLFAWDNEETFELAFAEFLGLGQMLGFTWEEIEQAYYSKNQINHERQNNGY